MVNQLVRLLAADFIDFIRIFWKYYRWFKPLDIMKIRNAVIPIVIKQVAVAVCLCQAFAAKATVDLGAAGPSNFAVLEIGNGNVSIANASDAGGITGNVGIGSGGSISDSGTPIQGNVVTYDSTAGNPPLNPNVAANVSGSISQNSASMAAAISAVNAAVVSASALSSSGGGMGYSSINLGNNVTLNLNPGVYNLSQFALANGDVVNLAAGGSYVFNIDGTLKLNSAEILAAAGLSDANILFNIIGSQAVQFSGGLNQESVLDGVIMAPDANVQVTPGVVNGEIISGENISIASGASVNNNATPVPEATTVLSGLVLLLPLGAGPLLRLARNRTGETAGAR